MLAQAVAVKKSKIRGKGVKRDESEGRRHALAAIAMWYEMRLEQGSARYQREKKRVTDLDVPSEHLHQGTYIGPPPPDPWKLTAHGVETKPPGRSREPRGAGSVLEIFDRGRADKYRAAEWARAEILKVTSSAMFDLIMVNPKYHMVVEMWAAGWSFDVIGRTLKIGKPLAQQYFECGVTWVAGCLMRRKKAAIHEKLKRRRCQWGDLYAGVLH